MRRVVRLTAGAAAMAITLALAAPQALGLISPGSISVVYPGRWSFASQNVSLAWAYRTGAVIKSATSKVNVQLSPDGKTWSWLYTNLPINSGEVAWDTRSVPDHLYAVRVAVVGTKLSAVGGPLVLDNTAPVVHVTRPLAGDVIVEDTSVAPVGSGLVVGTVTFKGTATDNLSGVRSVKWQVDGNDVTPAGWVGDPKNNYSFTYNGFESDGSPSQHTITMVAVDRSGNIGQSSVTVSTLPGTGAVTGALQPSPGGSPSPSSSPSPSGSPAPAPLPIDPSTLPIPNLPIPNLPITLPSL